MNITHITLGRTITPAQAAYCEAVRRAIVADDNGASIKQWLTTTCTECGEIPPTPDDLPSIESLDGDHVTIGRYVVLGCEDYEIVNPAAVGLTDYNPRPELGIPYGDWQDWTAPVD